MLLAGRPGENGLPAQSNGGAAPTAERSWIRSKLHLAQNSLVPAPPLPPLHLADPALEASRPLAREDAGPQRQSLQEVHQPQGTAA
jgi:hypothetical protein